MSPQKEKGLKTSLETFNIINTFNCDANILQIYQSQHYISITVELHQFYI